VKATALLASLAVAAACAVQAAEPAPVRLVSFELTDQFGTVHRQVFPRDKPLLLLVGDRKGSEEVDAWIAPLKQQCAGRADLAGIADIAGAPRFLRSRITEALRQKRPKPLMLDFEGTVTAGLHCTARTANLFVIDTNGVVRARLSGAADESHLQAARAALATVLPAAD